MNLDFTFLTKDFFTSFILNGLWYSVQLTTVAMIGGMGIGVIIALMRLSKNKWYSIPAKLFVDLLRSIPLVMVILWFYLLNLV